VDTGDVADALPELCKETALPDARRSDHAEERRLRSVHHRLPGLMKLLELVIAADQRDT
jgi:hypothetical protein